MRKRRICGVFFVCACTRNVTYLLFYKNCSIYSFEPIKTTFDILNSNLKTFSNIKTYNVALGSREGRGTMFSSLKESDRASFNIDNLNDENSSTPQNVQITTLSSFVIEHNIDHIDLLKIDVEGSELEVIKGAESILPIVSHVLLEIHLQANSNSFSELIKILAQNNFRPYKLGKIWAAPTGELHVLELIFKKV